MILDRRSLVAALGAAPAVALPTLAAARAGDAVIEAPLDSVFERFAPVGLGAALVSREEVYASGVRGLRRKDGTEPTLGPDATGLGQIYYYALEPPPEGMDLAELRSLQDYHIKYSLQSVEGVSEALAETVWAHFHPEG